MASAATRQGNVDSRLPRVAWVLQREMALILSGLFLLALGVRLFWIWSRPFDGLYGQDAYAYYGYAVQLLDALAHARVPPPFWWPFGYPALLAVSFSIFGSSIHSAQLVTLVSGAAVSPLIYLVAREIEGGKSGAGLIAGIVLALGGQAVQSSVVVMADSPGIMWATCSAWLLLRYRRTGGGPALLVSTAALAWAILTRWENLALVPGWVGALILISACQRPINWGKIIGSLALFILLLTPQLHYQLSSSAPLAGQSWLEGWWPGNLFARTFDTVDGHFLYTLPVAIFYAQVIAHPAYLVPILTPFVFIGAWSLARRAAHDPSPLVLMLGWIAVAFVFLAGIPYENFRFGLAFFPPLAVLAGIGVAQAWAWACRKFLTVPSSVGSPSTRLLEGVQALAGRSGVYLAGACLALLAVFVMLIWEPRVLEPVLRQKGSELAQAQWLERYVPKDATVYTFSSTAALALHGHWQVADLSDESPESVRADLLARAPVYLFLDVVNIESQWRDHKLDRTWRALESQLNLKELARKDQWTLFKIEAAR